MEEKITMLELLAVMRKRFRIIIFSVVIGILTATGYTFFVLTPQYSSTTQILVNQTQEIDGVQSSDISMNIQLISTYTDMIKNAQILNTVIEELELSESTEVLREQISVSAEENSQIFSLYVTTDRPDKAKDIANTTALVLKDYINSVMNVDNVTIISEATSSASPVSPNTVLNLIMGTFIGSMVGIGLALLPEFYDTSIKDEKYIVKELGWISFGSIPEMTTEEMKPDKPQTVPQISSESPSHSKV